MMFVGHVGHCRSMLVTPDLHEKADNHAENTGVRTNVGQFVGYIVSLQYVTYMTYNTKKVPNGP